MSRHSISLSVGAGLLATLLAINVAVAQEHFELGTASRVQSADAASTLLRSTTFVEYNPSTFVPADQEDAHDPTVDEIREDLKVLIQQTHKIRGLITFGADTPGLAAIPQIGKEEGFQRVIMGLQLVPGDQDGNLQEIQNALGADQSDSFLLHFAGDAIKHEQDVADYIRALKASGKPVGLRVEYNWISRLGDMADFLAVSSNTEVWRNGGTPVEVLQEFELVRDNLLRIGGERPLIISHVCYPSGPTENTGLTEANQLDFYRQLMRNHQWQETNDRPPIFFAVYDAFDPKTTFPNQDPAEAHRGLFRNDRSGKPAVAAFVGIIEVPQDSGHESRIVVWSLLGILIVAVASVVIVIAKPRRQSLSGRSRTYRPREDLKSILTYAYGAGFETQCGCDRKTVAGLVDSPEVGRFKSTYVKIVEKLNQDGQLLNGKQFNWTDLVRSEDRP